MELKYHAGIFGKAQGGTNMECFLFSLCNSPSMTHNFTAFYDEEYHTSSELNAVIEVVVALLGVAAFAPQIKQPGI